MSNKIKIIILLTSLVAITLVFAGCSKKNENNNTSNNMINGEKYDGLVIPVKDITSDMTVYPVTIDKVKMEVLAVKASDGSIRTSFNTCQVCYNSPAGYYKQKDNLLICQNCGNVFEVDQVEQVRGGCNPVPITSDDKLVDDEYIKIPNDFMKEYKDLFSKN